MAEEKAKLTTNLVTPPEDQIIVSINNLTGQANMALSRDLPAPYVAAVLSRLVAQTMEDLMRKQMAAPKNPFVIT